MLSKETLLKIIKNGETSLVDFKEEHHTCNLLLLHDILCLANSIGNNDRYLIFGIKENPLEIIGVQNTKKENNFIDLIRSAKLNRLPEIYLKEFDFDKKIIQVLIIKNKFHKPYYFNKEYLCNGKSCGKHGSKPKFLSAGSIYTRDATSNTPINETASEVQTQEMWEERFGIRQDPFSRIKNYLNNETDSWIRTSSNMGFDKHRKEK